MGIKATFILDEKIIEKGRDLVKKKRFKSLNAFVEKSIRDKLEILEKEDLKEAFREASKDPLFLADINETEKDFIHSDFEKAEK